MEPEVEINGRHGTEIPDATQRRNDRYQSRADTLIKVDMTCA